MLLGQAIKPLYFFQKLLCLWPFSLTWKSGLQIKTKRSILGNIYVIALVFTYVLWHFATILENPLHKDDALGLILDTYGQYSAMSIMFILAAIRIFKQGKTMQVLEIIQEFDNRFFGSFAVDIDSRPWINKVIKLMCGGAVAIGCIEHWNCIMFVRDGPVFSSFCLMMCFIPHWYAWFAEVQYLSLLLLVQERFKVLAKEVDRIVGRKKAASRLQIYADEYKFLKIVELHERLEKACGLINSAFGIQNILLSVYQFIMIVTLVYDFCIEIVIPRPTFYLNLFADILWTSLFGFFLASKCFVNQITIAAANIGESVSNLFFSKNRKLQEQAKSFHLLQCYEKNIFSPLALFRFDMQLFFSVSTKAPRGHGKTLTGFFFKFQMQVAIMSYIVVLIQFDLSQMED